jgi:multicomponent Na+:H+ antiporter subunit E
MKKSKVVITLALALAWCLLIESFSLIVMASGVLVGAGCVFLSARFLPVNPIENVNFGKLITYPFFLIGQIFTSAIYVSRIIFKGAKIDIVKVDTKIGNDSIRVMLADSVTLTPGSVMLHLDEEEMTILWLRRRGSPDVEGLDKDEMARIIMGKLEDKLIKAESNAKKGGDYHG